MKSELAKTIDSIAGGGTCTHSMMCICICVFVKTSDSIANKNSRRESVPNKGWHFEARGGGRWSVVPSSGLPRGCHTWLFLLAPNCSNIPDANPGAATTCNHSALLDQVQQGIHIFHCPVKRPPVFLTTHHRLALVFCQLFAKLKLKRVFLWKFCTSHYWGL